MKEQNPDIPFVVRTKGKRGTLHLKNEAAVNALILDPRSILLCNEGAYEFVAPQTVCNAARVLRDKLRNSHATDNRLVLEFYMHNAGIVSSAVGHAIESMVAEIKTLQKNHEESYPEATSSG